MNKKLIFIVLAAILALSLSACSFSTGAAPAANANPAQPRSINVSGNGKVYLTPDVAYVSIGVKTNAVTVGEALTANNTQAQAIAKTLQDLGVQAKDIQTANFNIYPYQEVTPDGKTLPTTFNVENTVSVTVRDLSILGKLLDAVVRSGANTINSITFDVIDHSKALSEARKLAVEDAAQQANEVAAAAGVKIDGLQIMNVNIGSGPILYDAKSVGAGVSPSAQVPVSAGQLVISVDVSAVYTIK